MKESTLKRINVLLRQDQYETVQRKQISLSGLIRDLIDDHFSEKVVVLHVGHRTRELYDRVISNFGATDQELEQHFLKALDGLLAEKGKQIEKTRSALSAKRG